MPFRRLSKPLATNPVFKKRFDELEFDAMEIMDDVEETAATVNSDEVPSTTTPMGALASVAGLAAGAAAGLAAFPLDVVGRGMQSTGSILKGQGLGIDRFSAWDETERAEAEAEAEKAAEALAMAREQSRRAEEAMARSAIDVARAIEAAKVAAGAEVSAAKAMAAAAERALEVEREKRINHTASAAARRMLRASISRAWEQWTDITRTRARNLRLLRVAGSRVLKPKRFAAFMEWRRSWDDAMREIAAQEWENAALEAVEAAQIQAEADVAEVRAAAEEALAAAQREAAEAKALAEQMRARLEALEAAAAQRI